MKKLVARLGDSTTTGGKIISATAKMYDHGKPIALDGDRATCARCKGTFGIFGTGRSILQNGRAVVVSGDLVLCPCKKNHVVSGGAASYSIEQTGHHNARAPTQHPSHAFSEAEMPRLFNEKFQIISRVTGKPLRNTEYAVERETGAIEFGITDQDGFTHLLSSTPHAELVSIYVQDQYA